MSPNVQPQPQFIMDDVKLLFNDLTSPESGVKFIPPTRANPGTIQSNINPPAITWTWADQAARLGQVVTESDIGKYGVQSDANALFRLTSATPPVWQAVQIGTTATWTWPNQPARLAEVITQDDVGKIGIQTDINTLFQLTNATPPIWQIVPNPTNTSSPFELSTGAADADSYHDFFRLQIAFEDVWAELLDQKLQPIGEQLYAQWDALMDQSPNFDDTGATDRATTFLPSPPDNISGKTELDDFIAELKVQLAIGRGGSSTAVSDPFKDDLFQTLVECNMLLDQLNRVGKNNGWSGDDWLNDPLGAGQRRDAFNTILNEVQSVPSSALKDDLIQILDGCNMLLDQLNRVGKGGNWSDDQWLNDPFGAGQRRDAFNTIVSEVQSLSPSALKDALIQTLTGCNMLLDQLNRVGKGDRWSGDQWLNDPFGGGQRRDVFNTILNEVRALAPFTQDITFPDLEKVLGSLDAMLKEPYRFDVFAPDSINYGLLLNYRQHWQPQSYQVGNLVSTIPLAPQETRRYTTKTVIKKTRNVKEIDDSLRSGRDESSNTWRVDSEIVERAKNQTNFQKNASGSFGNDNLYKVSAGMQQGQDQAVESAQTKREFHESVVKSAQEYRNEHRLEITTEESREDETTSYREIRNPNDELTVTYLFYELQRRYLVDEALHKVTPVILVANDVPAPHEIDQAWILRYDWIIKRTILDDSFLPALNYLSANYAGEELTLQILELAVQQQKGVVDRISQQVQLANVALNAATVGLEKAETQEVDDLRAAETASIVKGIFDPLGITGKSGDGNSDRARVDFAKEALNRTQTKVDQLVSNLKGETTALQVAIDKYTKAATEHFSMLADIDRLRVHIKDNIIYYMQAIWTYEPADQRYFRLCNVDVPVFAHNTTVNFSQTLGLGQIDNSRLPIDVTLASPTLLSPTKKLHQVADIENLIGFKGNYMIFPMVDFNYMTWFMMQDYLHIDETTGVTAQDPDPLAGLSINQMKDAMATVYAADPNSFEAKVTVTLSDGTTQTVTKQQIFEEIMHRLLTTQNPEMVIVPSNSLYIEALPGTHPLLEDFKLIHRAIDVKKAQAEARHAELENLRLAARLSNSELGDPDIDKVVVVGSNQNVTVDAGQ